MKKRSIIYSLFVLLFTGIQYLQNGGIEHFTSGYGVIHKQTITWDTFQIMPGVDRNTFCHGLHKVESKQDNYLAYNAITSALGRYQFVPKYFWDSIQTVTKATSYSDFLNTPEYQEQFMDYYIDSTLLPGFEKVMANIKEKDKIYTDQETLALVHFLGANGAIEYISTQVMNEKQQVGNIDASKYIEIVNQAMEAFN